MKRKVFSLFLALVLVLALVSCDNVTSIMGKMGENVMGADETQAAAAVETVTKTEETKAEETKKEETKTQTTHEETTYEEDADGNVVATTKSNSTAVVIEAGAKSVSYTDSTGNSKSLFTVGKVKDQTVNTEKKVANDGTTTITTTTVTKDAEGNIKTVTVTTDGEGNETKKETKVTNSKYEEIEESKFGEGYNAVVVGSYSLPVADEDVSKLETVLPPQDLTEVAKSLEGTTKDKVVEKLNEKVTEDSTRKAAVGSATLVKSAMNIFAKNDSSESDKKSDTSDSTRASVTDTSAAEGETPDLKTVLEKVKENINDVGNGEKLTNGDVLIMKALTNVIVVASDHFEQIQNIMREYSKNNESGMSAEAAALMNEVVDTVLQTLNIFVASCNSSSIFGNLGLDKLASQALQYVM